jgi:hypothetical protein
MIVNAISLAIPAGFSILLFRVILSHQPLKIKDSLAQLIISSMMGVVVWIVSMVILLKSSALQENNEWDFLCGVLILLCAFWCNYWISNLAGGFRIHMQLSLAENSEPLTIEEWMASYDKGGMELFLSDRIESILVRNNIVMVENGLVRLTSGPGYFWAKVLSILNFIFPNLRAD